MASIDSEIALVKALESFVEALAPLSDGGRARVILVLILQYQPNLFGYEQFRDLLQQAKKP
jgi:hypothetical protein